MHFISDYVHSIPIYLHWLCQICIILSTSNKRIQSIHEEQHQNRDNYVQTDLEDYTYSCFCKYIDFTNEKLLWGNGSAGSFNDNGEFPSFTDYANECQSVIISLE